MTCFFGLIDEARNRRLTDPCQTSPVKIHGPL